MIARLVPDTSQLRFWTQSALNAFDTLDLETAAEVAQADLSAILTYLDALQRADAIPVSRGRQIEAGITLELGGS